MKNWKIQLLIITVITIIAFINIFPNSFAVDDKTFIVNWEETRSLANIPKFFQGDVPEGHQGVYRPIRNSLYAIYYKAFGTNPFWYHLHSLAVHLASTILVFFIVKLILQGLSNALERPFIAFAAAILFATHPIHTETIVYISSSLDATGVVFFFASFYLYLRSRIGNLSYLGYLSYLTAVVAFFTYEVTLVLPLLIILYEVCFGFKSLKFLKLLRLLKGSLPYFALAAIYFAIRFLLLHISTRGPYLANSPYLTFLTMIKVFVQYISLLVWPVNLSLNHIISKGIEAFVYRDYRTDAIMSQSLFDKGELLGILGILGLLGLAIKLRKKFPLITFGILWFFISLLPVSEIVPQGSVLNERFLYIPSVGFVVIVGWLLGKLGRLGKLGGLWMFWGVVFFLALFYSYLTVQRNRDWRNDITIWSKDIERAPNENAYAHLALGIAYEDAGKSDLSLKEYQKAFDINPHFVVAVASKGVVYANMGKTDLAIESYKKAIAVSPYFWEGHNNLGNIYLTQGKTDLAESELRQTLSLNPNFLPARVNLETLLSDKIGTPSAIGKQDNWIKYVSSDHGFSFKYPADWIIEERNKTLIISSDTKTFTIELYQSTRAADLSAVDYVKKQNQTYGRLVNQGLAKIPNMDFGFVKVWDFEGKPKLQFFLFKKDKTIEVLVFPGDSVLMRQFDGVLGSIEFK